MNRVLLVGPMGTGKSTVGRLLAERLGWRYVDSDLEVERCTGQSVAQLFSNDGEEAFRAQESRVLLAAVAEDHTTVVSVAGGAVLDPANRELLRRSGIVVWLRARPSTLAGRVGDGVGRPLLAGTPLATLARLDETRRSLYAEVADVVVDVDDVTVDDVVDRVQSEVATIGATSGVEPVTDGGTESRP